MEHDGLETEISELENHRATVRLLLGRPLSSEVKSRFDDFENDRALIYQRLKEILDRQSAIESTLLRRRLQAP